MNAPRQAVDLEAINGMDRATFVATLGDIFEHSPWVAEAAWTKRPFADVGALHAAMLGAARAADRRQQLALFNAHPELAGKEAVDGTLTATSTVEQASA